MFALDSKHPRRPRRLAINTLLLLAVAYVLLLIPEPAAPLAAGLCSSPAFACSCAADGGKGMAAVFTTANQSEGRLRIRGRESEPPEIEFIPRDAEVVHDVRNDATRHIAWMPRKGDEAIRAERIRKMPVAAGAAERFAADFAEAAFQLATVECGVFAHESGGENKFVAEGERDGASGFEQRLQMRFGGLLKAKGGFAAVATVRVATRQERGFGDPDTILVLTELNFRERNNHCAVTVTRSPTVVKRAFNARLLHGSETVGCP